VDRLIDIFPPHQQNQIRSQLALCLLAILSQRLVPRADGKGRVAACELMRNISATAHLIREGKIHNIYTVMETSARDGMCTMDASLKQLYMSGVITRDEARRRMRNPEMLNIGGASRAASGRPENGEPRPPAKQG